MDPQAALDSAEYSISVGNTREAREYLNNYRNWRAGGGYAPPDGDRRERELRAKLRGAGKGGSASRKRKLAARDRATVAFNRATIAYERAEAKARMVRGAEQHRAQVKYDKAIQRARGPLEKAARAVDKAQAALGPAERMDDAQARARDWLIENDPEGADFWRAQPRTTDFVAAKRQNIQDFGPEED